MDVCRNDEERSQHYLDPPGSGSGRIRWDDLDSQSGFLPVSSAGVLLRESPDSQPVDRQHLEKENMAKIV